MSAPIEDWLAAAARDRNDAGLRRVIRPRAAGADVLDVAGNDYLGLSRDPRVVAGAVAAAQLWGAGSGGSRLVTGTTQAHVDLERALAGFLDAEAALVFSSGYTANLGVIAALGGRDALVVSDADNHASIVDGCRLSRSRVAVTPRGDVGAVRAALAGRTEARALVVVDAVFSVDGSLGPVADLLTVCRENGAVLVVDEAHALGVIGEAGQGLCVQEGIAAEPDLVRTVTLSKALGSQGGAVLATAAIVEHLLNTARTFIFDTGLAPACVGAAATALELLRADPQLVAAVRSAAGSLATALDVEAPSAAVVSLVLGDPSLALGTAELCREAGVLVGCFRPPTVPIGESRVRLTARADLSVADIDRAATTVLHAVKALR